MNLPNKFAKYGLEYPKNIDYLDLLRCIGILLVVLRHSFAPFTDSGWEATEYYEKSLPISTAGYYVSFFSMPLFVFISGYLYAFLRIHLGKYPSYAILIRKKVRRLLVPFLILAPLYILAFREFNGIKEFLILMLNDPGHFWFLLMLFMVFLTFYVFEEIVLNYPKGIMIFTCLLFCTYPVFGFLQLIPLLYFVKYLPFFVLGFLFFAKNDDVEKFLRGKVLIMILLHSILFVAYIYLEHTDVHFIVNKTSHYLTLLPIGFLSISILYMLARNSKKHTSGAKKYVLKFINDNSYYLYIIHEPILIIFFAQDQIQNLPAPVVILTGFFLAVSISLAMSVLLKKNKFGRILIGA